jgi:hypothetical protein
VQELVHRRADLSVVDSPHPGTTATEALLSDAFGIPVAIERFEHLTPWAVMRCQLASTADSRVPASVVVKWLRQHPTGFRTDPAQVITECVALEFLAELGVDLAPRVLASDPAAGVLVLEDLSPRTALFDLLIGDDPRAGIGLRAFARSLGELHAATAGHSHTWYARRAASGPVDPDVERMRFLGKGWREVLPSVYELGVPVPLAVEADVEAVLGVFADPGPYSAFSNGDAGVNNFMVDGVDGRFTDFEFAGYRHALSDLACLHVPGSMWMTVADPVPTGIESEYRTALCRGVPEAEDDRTFGLGIAAGSLAFAIMRLGRLALLDTRPPGDLSRPQMVATLEAASAAADGHRALPHLSGWARSVAGELRQRWPDADLDFATDRYMPRF